MMEYPSIRRPPPERYRHRRRRRDFGVMNGIIYYEPRRHAGNNCSHLAARVYSCRHFQLDVTMCAIGRMICRLT